MLPRRLAVSARPLASTVSRTAPRVGAVQTRYASQADTSDPNMDGGYENPPAQKRQFRDPYGDWWDKQERKNFGEPVNMDNDILGIFSPEVYTYTTPGKGAVMMGTFVAAVGALAYGVYLTYPDKPSAPREFQGGLDKELGGDRAVRARKEGEGQWASKKSTESTD